MLMLALVPLAAGDDMPEVIALFQLTNGTNHEYDASWSPDDSRIVYTIEGTYGSELWVMDMDGSNKVMYLQSSAWVGQPDWGENGILYTSDYSMKRDRHLDIWIVEGEGMDSKRLSSNKTDQQYASWDNNESKILFLGRANYDYEIWTMNPDATNVTRLTFYQTAVETPSWSPDSTKIIYTKEGDIWVMDNDAANPVQLTSNDSEETDPDWSPDGKWIAYANASQENGDFDIWIMRPDGTDKTPFISESRDQTEPKWSNGGSVLLYTSYQDLNRDVWAASLYIEPPAAITPEPTSLPTQIVIDTETKENISRLTLLGAAVAILVMLFIIIRIIKGMKKR